MRRFRPQVEAQVISTVESVKKQWRTNSKTGEVGKTAFNSSRNHKGQHVERWETHGEKQLRLPKWQGSRQDVYREQPADVKAA